jgi:hypothetical protein
MECVEENRNVCGVLIGKKKGKRSYERGGIRERIP